MTIKSNYERFQGSFVRVLTPDGNLYGKLNEITDNNIVLNPYLDDTYSLEGQKEISLVGNDFMYARGMIRGMNPKSEDEIKGLAKFIQKGSSQQNSEKKE